MTRNLILEIAKGVGLSAGDVVRIIRTAPYRYKVFSIPKRRGVGTRIIAQPTRPLKLIQRFLVTKVLDVLPVSSAAFAYRHQINIGNNARVHAGHTFLLKLDFRDFFGSISPDDLLSRVSNGDWLNADNRAVLTLSLFRQPIGTKRLSLAMGAPSSPAISNIVMYQFDEAVLALATDLGVTYTRYADDLTFSSDDRDALMKIEAYTRKLIAETSSPRLLFNDAKRGVYKRGQKQLVTGLILTPDGKVSIGRERKRLISAGVDRIRKGFGKEEGHLQNIRGWIAFANAVEPDFVKRLRRKYGTIVDEILRRPVKRPERPNPTPIAPPPPPAPTKP